MRRAASISTAIVEIPATNTTNPSGAWDGDMGGSEDTIMEGGKSMTRAARPPLLQRLARMLRPAPPPLAAVELLMAYVRGNPVPPPPVDRLPQLIARACDSAPRIDSQAALDDVAAIASALVADEGVTPGPFYVLHLPRLDT